MTDIFIAFGFLGVAAIMVLLICVFSAIAKHRERKARELQFAREILSHYQSDIKRRDAVEKAEKEAEENAKKAKEILNTGSDVERFDAASAVFGLRGNAPKRTGNNN